MRAQGRDPRPPVYVEFPNFGFGPAVTALALIAGVPGPYRWHLVSTGDAGAFARKQLPEAVHHDLCTFEPASWKRFRDLAPPGALTLSVTNPDFAGWAANQGYTVGIVDTLDWMWPALPEGVDAARFHLAQVFFGKATNGIRSGAELVQPIVDPSLWPSGGRAPQPKTAAISFGGMHVPLPSGQALVADYARWLLDAALPVLIDQGGMTKVTILGGRPDLVTLLPDRWARHPAIRVRPSLPRATYSKVLLSAEHALLSPGLGSLYDCAASGLAPLLQPGWNVSMLLQAYHVALTGYDHLCPWPWLEEAVEVVSRLPERDGFNWTAGRIQSMLQAGWQTQEAVIVKPLLRYLERGAGRAPLRLRVPDGLPTAVDRLAYHLRSLSSGGP